jgi:hypothetical protein
LPQKNNPDLDAVLGKYLAEVQLNQRAGSQRFDAPRSLQPFAGDAAKAIAEYNSWASSIKAKIDEVTPQIRSSLR